MRDNSKKEWEIQIIQYKFHKYSRKRIDPNTLMYGEWSHYKYYSTLLQAEDAIRDFRRSYYDKAYSDYPSMGNIDNEKIFSHIKPTLTATRYRIVKRNIKT